MSHFPRKSVVSFGNLTIVYQDMDLDVNNLWS